MVDVALQVLGGVNGGVCPQVEIHSSVFNGSRIEMQSCLAESETKAVTSITNSDFYCKNQPYTIIMCSCVSENTSLSLNVTLVEVNFFNSYEILLPFQKLNSLCTNADFRPTGPAPTDIYVSSGNVNLTIKYSTFNGSYGTAIQAQNSAHSVFTVTQCTFSGFTQGALVFSDGMEGVQIILTKISVTNNSIKSGAIVAAGLTVSAMPTTQLKVTSSSFKENTDYGGSMQIIKLQDINQAIISDSEFRDNNGTVIDADKSNITFTLRTVTFTGNTALQGGALTLRSSTLSFATTINFTRNSATQFGGAIYIDDPQFYLQNDLNTQIWCFYQPLGTSGILNFYKNSARQGGDHIYGTSMNSYCQTKNADKSEFRYHIQPNTSLSPISSRALRVCMCGLNGQPQCADESKIFISNYTVCPGEVFSVSVVATGTEFGTTVGEIHANLLPGSSTSFVASLGDQKQKVQQIPSNDHCISLNYSIHTRNHQEVIYFTSTDITLNKFGDIEGIKSAISMYRQTNIIPIPLLMAPVFINVTVKPCPLGFSLVGEPPLCDCYPELREINITCTIQNGRSYFSRTESNWIGVESTAGIDFNGYCPLELCKQEKVLVDPATDPDVQCANNHSGTLCGGCKEGYSVAIGSSHCVYCPNNYNSALFLFFVFAGPLLYVLIDALDLTITRGAINGLLFYANIVWIHQNVLLLGNDQIRNKAIIHFLKIFIAWLNLDFGFKACFFKMLDAFSKSILQYVFPLYIWIIAYVIIVVYRHADIHRHCLHLSKLKLTGNPTNVLVTFVLLSYTKLTRTIVATFGFEVLTFYPNNSTRIVWAVDGNVQYFKGKHIVTFITALLALVTTLLYTTYILLIGLKKYITLCGCNTQVNHGEEAEDQTMRGRDLHHRQVEEGVDFQNHGQKVNCTLCRCKSILNMPLPLYDAHFAPYVSKHRYWLGMMLFIRMGLLVTFSTTTGMVPTLYSLILMNITATILLFYTAWNTIYKDKPVQMLEGLSLGNLIFYSGGNIITDTKSSNNWKPVVFCISVGIAFIQFIGILIYHFAQNCFKKQKEHVNPTNTAVNIIHADPQQEQLGNAAVWREPLLNDDDNSEQEPLIAPAAPKQRSVQYLCCCNN